MSYLDDLVAQVSDPKLRAELASSLDGFKKSRKFGLTFEEHIPETAAIPGLPVQVGDWVQRRGDVADALHRVERVQNGEAIVSDGEGGKEIAPLGDLISVKRFGDPVVTALEPIGSIRRGPVNRPYHAVINGENFHALQLLTYSLKRSVDCIYIDPPYNTGARDWKYNNRFVDSNDRWRHSKWLAMMSRRLKLARLLLKPDGVLICTVDEHEIHHLGMLLEDVFKDYLRYMVTIVHNPKGTYKSNFARVEEYAFFCVPNTGRDVISPLPEGLFVQANRPKQLEDALSEGYEDLYLRRRGQESGYRRNRPNQFYAILVDEAREEVVGVGPSLGPEDRYEVTRAGSVVTVYPIDTRDEERVWRYNRETMESLIAAGEIVVTGYSGRTRQGWVLNHRRPKKTLKRIKTVWWEKRHDAGGHGSDLLTEYLGRPGLFPFPKSVYAVRDCIEAVVRTKPNSVILDFFAGSGTTLHAVCLLNAADDGRRRCLMVTNNEVEENQSRKLAASGYYPGDREYEQHGVFESVTRPRSQAVLTGRRPDGRPVEGEHIWADRRPYSQGFEENLEFYKLVYLDSDEVDLGEQFQALAPLLWFSAGGWGEREEIDPNRDFYLATAAPFAVLLKPSRLSRFVNELEKRTDVSHVWVVTDSEEAFAEVSEALPSTVAKVSQLYRDYLRSFKLNSGRL